MKAHTLLACCFLTSFFQTLLAFNCSDLEAKQCSQLQTEGCIWTGTSCTGSYSPSCLPPNCYYIDQNSQSPETPDGTPENPLKTLSDGFTKISGKDGFLIIINTLQDASVAMTKQANISSNITIKPLFEDRSFKIDFSQFPNSFTLIMTITKSLRLIGAKLDLQISGPSFGFTVFSLKTGRLYLENVKVEDTPTSLQSVINFVRFNDGSPFFSMMNCQFKQAFLNFATSSGGTMIWKNVTTSGRNDLKNSLSANTMMTMEDCFFTGGLGSFITAATSGSEILLKNCTFKELTISPIIRINSGVKTIIQDCIFDQMILTASPLFRFVSDLNTNGVFAVHNCSFTNIQVQTALFHLEGKRVGLSLNNVIMDNISQRQNITITQGNVAELTLPSGICCVSLKNAEIFVESSNFTNIYSNCFGIRDTALTIKSSIFDNSKLQGSDTPMKREDLSKINDRTGVSWINIEQTSLFFGNIYKVLIQDSKFIKNRILTKYGGAIQFKGIILSQIILTGNEFLGNTAYHGGAIYSENAFISIIQLANNIFVDNLAYNGGALYKIDKG